MHRIWIILATVAACASIDKSGPLYFDDPRSAVTEITKLLEAKDWPTLARYYDLSDSDVQRATLESGAFFYTDERPESGSQTGLWHYKHPFAPGYKFLESRDLKRVGMVEVTVMISIEQGGGLVQRGLQSYLMFHTANRYQLLPGRAPSR